MAATLFGCARAPVCEVEFRAAPGQPVDPTAVASACEVLRERLAQSDEARGFRVAPTSGSSLVITLTRPLDDAAVTQLRSIVESRGRLQFLAVAGAHTPGFDQVEEQRRLKAWRDAQPDADVAEFNQLARDNGGPSPSIEWHLGRAPGVPLRERMAEVCERALDPASTFTGADLSRAFPSSDATGFPAIGFEMCKERRGDFGAFTARCVKRRLAIVYDGEVLTAPTVNAPLAGSAIIEGRFSQQECEELVAILRSGELPLALEFVELRKLP